MDKLSKIEAMPESEQEKAKTDLLASKIDFLTQPMLADLEQGWGDPKKVFLSVVRCLQNGVNIMHIGELVFYCYVLLCEPYTVFAMF
jgi:isocitrate lyase